VIEPRAASPARLCVVVGHGADAGARALPARASRGRRRTSSWAPATR
jgi:hypothetical protein